MKFEVVKVFKAQDLAAFQAFAVSLSEYLKVKTIFLLKGSLGAGKTELVKSLVGDELDVVSPTFSLQQSYVLSSGLTLDHWDLYRLESEDDLESSGFWDQFMTEDYCVWIEWPERLEVQNLPRAGLIYQIEIKVVGEIREIQLSKRIS